MNQAVASGNDHAPGNLWMCQADVIGDTPGRLADQFQIAEGCIEGDTTGQECRLVHTTGV